ncbi:MAG: hypothetical protein WC784_02045 [Candidatus Shapirobacteria bacterium]|jgi:hypothetical protein
MKSVFWALVVGLSCLLFSGCEKKTETNIVKVQTQERATEQKNCQDGEVTVKGYGDKAKRLTNCFVEYPGEPSRQDKSYYIVEDICGQFTPELIGNALGKTIIKIEDSQLNDVYACSYYWDEKDYVMLVMDYLKIENQKKYWESVDNTVKEESTIPMRNLVVWKDEKTISALYWVLNDNKFISLERSSVKALSSEEILDFASKIGHAIKNYK